MSRRTMTWASLALIAAMLAASLVVAGRVPAGARLPIHWNIAGQADGFAGKWTSLMMAPGLAALIASLFAFLPAIEPRARNLARSPGLYLWAWAAILLVFVALELATVSAALHWGLRADHVIVVAVGAMLVVIGNQLGKSRSMYLVGIRTPWTLASEEVWIRTHRLGGKLMVLAGLAMMASPFLSLAPAVALPLMLALIGLSVVLPIAYSYWLWRKEKQAQPSE